MLDLLVAVAAAAAQVSPTASIPKSVAVESETPKDGDRLICKKDNAIGSRVAKRRTCMTARDWQRVQDATRDHLDEYTRRNTGGAARQ